MRVSQIQSILDRTTLSDAAIKRIMAKQVQRIQDRINAGVDINGEPFAPYRWKHTRNQARPLLRAARLFVPATIFVTTRKGGKTATLSIYGRAAKIAAWQNKLRRFYGYTRQDREYILQDAMSEIRSSRRRRR